MSVSLTARHLEANGIPTVVMASARDIVEQAGVARLLFTDFPLGNPCGAPYDVEMQRAITSMALDLFEDARFPRTTVQTPYQWPTDEWRRNFMLITPEKLEELRVAGEKRRQEQAERKAKFEKI